MKFKQHVKIPDKKAITKNMTDSMPKKAMFLITKQVFSYSYLSEYGL